MPAYNAELYIEETLDSVAAQERVPDEIVIVDDGSTDRTVETVTMWKARHDLNVRLIEQENQGSSVARNNAIQHAKSDLVAFLDADDLWMPNHLSTLERGFQRCADLVFCFGDAQSFDETGVIRQSYLRDSEICKLHCTVIDDLNVIQGSAYSAMVNGTGIATCSQMISREAALRIGLFDPELWMSQDLDLPLRLSREGSFGYFPTVVCKMRRHATNKTHKRHRLRH